MRTQQNNDCIYKAALYLRLSKDDENTGESSSISTQRDILKDFAQNRGITIADEYVDDGYSGTNFDRPAFKQMQKDIESGKINCVITKDLSRLGRNSARTTDLLDEYFPQYGVRYISVIDGYDSKQLSSGNIMATPFMLLMNEMYARDISNKIRTSFKAKMEKGDYIGNFAPYGYKKDIKNGNKNHLIIDDEVAPIVKEIFQMAADGMTPQLIANALNDRGIVTPSVYRCIKRPYLCVDKYSRRKEWTSSSICKMLRNEVYLGKTLQGKTSKISFKSKTTKSNNRSTWITVGNTHEAIITEDLFNIVRQRSVSRRTLPHKGFVNIFSGIAKCADCGSNMSTAPSKKKGAVYNLSCGKYKTYGAKDCSNHFIDYSMLYDVVLKDLQSWLSISREKKHEIVRQLEQENSFGLINQEIQDVNKEIDKSEKRKQEIGLLISKLYEDYAFNKITITTYEMLSKKYEDEYRAIQEMVDKLNSFRLSSVSKSCSYDKFFELLDDITAIDALSKEILQKFIERIDVEQGHYEKNEVGERVKHQKIRIYYKFIGCVSPEEKQK